MLGGSSVRKLPRDLSKSLQPAFEQLQLPWLCPAIYYRAQSSLRPQPQRRATATATPRRPLVPVRAQSSPSGISHPSLQERSYAYDASSDYRHDLESDDLYIPMEPGVMPGSSWARQSDYLPAFDPSDPLIISVNYDSPRTQHRFSNTSISEIHDLHSNLEACLAVGLQDRAAATLRRLTRAYHPDRPELVHAHNFFLGHLLGLHTNTRDLSLLQYAQKWYHVDMIRQGVVPDAATYALMIQLVLRDENQKKAARSIRKYAAEAAHVGYLDAVKAELGNVVQPHEYTQIEELHPGFFGSGTAMDESSLHTQEADDTLSETVAEWEGDVVWKDALPQVRSVDQKGEGLKALQKSLSVFNENPQVTEPSNEQELQRKITLMRQQRLEDEVEISAMHRWKADTELANKRGAIHGSLQGKSMSEVMWKWHEELLPLIRQEIGSFVEADSTLIGEDARRAQCALYLRFIAPEKLSVLTIVSTLNQFAYYGSHNWLPLSRVVQTIGKAIEEESAQELAKARRRNKFMLASPRQSQEASPGTQQKSEERAASSSRKYAASSEITQRQIESPKWTAAIKAKIGATMVSLLLKAAKLPPVEGEGLGVHAMTPGFTIKTIFHQGKRLGSIRCEKQVSDMLAKSPALATLTKHLPMLSEPLPWKGYKRGAFLRGGVPIVRMGFDTFQSKSYIKLAVDNGDMTQVMQGLDVLGRVPWKINRKVFEVMLKVWNTGDAFANFAPLHPNAAFPEPPAPDADFNVKIAYEKAKRNVQNELSGHHSNRCFQNFQLETARAYLDETFYMPHNLDFRGRAYPIAPYLNHMGADHCRGLLMFAKGKELGNRGLEWLKIHLANVYGYDKASLSERSSFAEEHLEDIRDAATSPLDGKKWWLEAEDPWQCLATCFELHAALESPDPTKFVSYLPVHQDGTCNGLQHYAALGGDEIGAKQVNLEPGDRPSDIYTAVANHVQKSISKDAQDGLKLAKLLDGKIVRKVVKQTVMTNVYGVTFQGAKLQVIRQLEDLYPDTFSHKDNMLTFLAATYIARNIFAALSSMFNGASAIQEWLGECAARICESLSPEQMKLLQDAVESKKETNEKAVQSKRSKVDELAEYAKFKSTVIWTTPLRMPVVQPYRSVSSQRVHTILQDISVVAPSTSDQVQKRKQLQAFPPNFIHSLDATHMLLSALRCSELNMSFAAVHDSFWTHAADVDTMSTVLRDAFVRMHGEDIIGRLATEFQARYKDCMYLAAISKHSVVGKKIAAWRKERGYKKIHEKTSKITEILEERKRIQLLSSEDTTLRAQGEAMITPARIYSEATDEAEFLPMRGTSDPEVMRPDPTSFGAAAESAFEEDLDTSNEVEQQGQQSSSKPSTSWEALQAAEKERVASALSKSAPQDTQEMAEQLKAYTPTNKSPSKSRNEKLWVWLPLSFPPVPKKGQWDVNRLKKSKYFFS